MSAIVSAVGHLSRAAGRVLDRVGQILEVAPYVEHLAPSTKVVAYSGKTPAIHTTAFVAPSASVVGEVAIGKGSSVWYGAVLRGDVNKIVIGEQSSIGDRAVVHVARFRGDSPTNIGSRVTIGQGAVVHACTLEDESVIGAKAQVLDRAVVQKHAVVGPGSVVSPGKTVPSGQLWAGVPAKFVRDLTAEEIAHIKQGAVETFEVASVHKAEAAKDYKQVAADFEDWEDKQYRSRDYFQRLKDRKDPAEIMGLGVPGRIFNHPLTVPLSGEPKPEEAKA